MGSWGHGTASQMGSIVLSASPVGRLALPEAPRYSASCRAIAVQSIA
jgi:hypothetical protein